MGKQIERTYCEYINDGVTWTWRTKESKRNPGTEERDCILDCSGNNQCAKKQSGNWKGRGLEGAKPKEKCPICKKNLSCEMVCY